MFGMQLGDRLVWGKSGKGGPAEPTKQEVFESFLQNASKDVQIDFKPDGHELVDKADLEASKEMLGANHDAALGRDKNIAAEMISLNNRKIGILDAMSDPNVSPKEMEGLLESYGKAKGSFVNNHGIYENEKQQALEKEFRKNLNELNKEEGIGASAQDIRASSYVMAKHFMEKQSVPFDEQSIKNTAKECKEDARKVFRDAKNEGKEPYTNEKGEKGSLVQAIAVASLGSEGRNSQGTLMGKYMQIDEGFIKKQESQYMEPRQTYDRSFDQAKQQSKEINPAKMSNAEKQVANIMPNSANQMSIVANETILSSNEKPGEDYNRSINGFKNGMKNLDIPPEVQNKFVDLIEAHTNPASKVIMGFNPEDTVLKQTKNVKNFGAKQEAVNPGILDEMHSVGKSGMQFYDDLKNLTEKHGNDPAKMTVDNPEFAKEFNGIVDKYRPIALRHVKRGYEMGIKHNEFNTAQKPDAAEENHAKNEKLQAGINILDKALAQEPRQEMAWNKTTPSASKPAVEQKAPEPKAPEPKAPVQQSTNWAKSTPSVPAKQPQPMMGQKAPAMDPKMAKALSEIPKETQNAWKQAKPQAKEENNAKPPITTARSAAKGIG